MNPVRPSSRSADGLSGRVWRIVLAGLVGLAASASGCRQEAPISPDIRQRLEPIARGFCETIVPCVRQDMERHMHEEPQRRHYLGGRMTQSACVEAQVRSFSVRPDDGNLLRQCGEILAQQPDCTERLASLRRDPCGAAVRLQ